MKIQVMGMLIAFMAVPAATGGVRVPPLQADCEEWRPGLYWRPGACGQQFRCYDERHAFYARCILEKDSSGTHPGPHMGCCAGYDKITEKPKYGLHCASAENNPNCEPRHACRSDQPARPPPSVPPRPAQPAAPGGQPPTLTVTVRGTSFKVGETVGLQFTPLSPALKKLWGVRGYNFAVRGAPKSADIQDLGSTTHSWKIPDGWPEGTYVIRVNGLRNNADGKWIWGDSASFTIRAR